MKSFVATLVLAVLVGHVTDATTGQPLANVTVAIGSHRTTTAAAAPAPVSPCG